QRNWECVSRDGLSSPRSAVNWIRWEHWPRHGSSSGIVGGAPRRAAPHVLARASLGKLGRPGPSDSTGEHAKKKPRLGSVRRCEPRLPGPTSASRERGRAAESGDVGVPPVKTSTESTHAGIGEAMESPAASTGEDVRRSGYLRNRKSMHRRYFVLRAASERGPARLEYYESEKKFRGKAPVPKKAVALETCFNINKRADSKNKHMIVLYTRAESLALAAESEADQDDWFQALVELQCKSK
ncbi:unnamed protein product, partial [Tetraodon nigroviridis]